MLEQPAFIWRSADQGRYPQCFAGIRPWSKLVTGQYRGLVARPYIHIDKSGLLSIAGGKWTTYRNMAQDCVDQAATLAIFRRRTA